MVVRHWKSVAAARLFLGPDVVKVYVRYAKAKMMSMEEKTYSVVCIDDMQAEGCKPNKDEISNCHRALVEMKKEGDWIRAIPG